ncbi:MAG: flagellar export protein FliJ [Solirubrobacteraceae bacterium]
MSGPSFRFSLERVRALRERAEDAAREALAGAIQDHHRTQVATERAAQTVLDARDVQLEGTGVPVGAAELLARQAYLEHSERTHRASLDALSGSEARVAQERHTLTEAARDRQALERLKDNRRADFEREQARLENLALDEIALNNYRRREAA